MSASSGSAKYAVIFSLFISCFIDCLRHTIKIVEEPSNYGLMNSYQGGAQQSERHKLKMRVTPSNVSGPALFLRFKDKCFSKSDESYKYEFCPFSNVTQHEVSLRWNPYSGILGVWQEWEIVNNTFVAMVMREGDKCGAVHRTTKVTFHCGKENRVTNVTEPSTCNYLLTFDTPYVCHPHAMLVYPTLGSDRQTEWGLLEGQLARGEITKKGYDKYLGKIFARAGYYLNEERKRAIAAAAIQQEQRVKEEEDGHFDNLFKCTEEYQKLKKKFDGLKALLDLNKDAGDPVGGGADPHLDSHMNFGDADIYD